MARKKSTMPDVYKSFASLKEFEHYLTVSKKLVGMPNESKDGDYTFTNTESYDKANNLMLYGDYNLREKIEKQGVAKLKANLNKYVVRRQVFTSVQGFAPNVPNYIAGVPNSMINVRQKHVKQNVVTVFYNCAVAYYVTADQITEAVTKLCCALIRLEAQGIRVNLYAGTLGDAGGQKAAFAVKIKSSGQPFDTLKMMYPLAHPSFNRRHKFRFIEVTEGIDTKEWCIGYGSSQTDDGKTKTFLKEHGLNVDCAFNYQSVADISQERIINKITDNK